MLALLAPLTLLLNGLAAGVLFGTQLGGFPYLASLPVDRYVHAHAFFGTRYDPAMPLCLVGTVGCDTALAFLTPEPAARAAFAVAAVLAVATAVISVTRNAPVNRWMRTLDPDRLPADFADPRRSWGAWNRRRSVLAVAALLANCAGLGVLL
ncbi:anthrone oxygenase family protein [Streptomyces chrestomyceticus]|uniref:anthrone oxygenase family protein n=1 Tax=Streptomyces chrestomyceticus TaxID=68185 RepID=UPI0019D05719|nr:anthrone oxygenase family protein [Streptomyces chrestomyceticus]